MRFLVCCLICISVAIGAGMEADIFNTKPSKAFNYILGTQTFGPKYQFTNQTRLVETAAAINEMGSNVLKCYIGPKAIEQYKLPDDANNFKSLKDLAAGEQSYQKIFQMPFDFYLLWVYSYAEPNDVLRKGWNEDQKKGAYKEVYDLACFLLTKYNDSGKTFYFGQWEGDWAMHNAPLKYENEPTDLAIASTIDWLNTRQAAIEAAKKDTPHKNVEIYNYLELNIVFEAMKGHKSMVNSVLGKTNVDYVSYSSYDAIYPYDENLNFEQRVEWVGKRLKTTLDYIESKLPAKNVPGKRVFIGEYGYPVSAVGTAKAQNEASLAVAIAAMEWGCPFVLYWEIYDNEADEGGANGKGYWMIDNKGVKQPIYKSHYQYYQWAKKYVAENTPDEKQFRAAAAEFLKNIQ
ncbi:MAG: hypothetical protein ABFD79_17640 [Phycisphaerales bacterium]